MPVSPTFMRRLRRRLDDRGGITMVFVLLISGGVTLGTGAIVADVGNIYAERGQLQAGADGAALAVAENCARIPSTCASLAGTTAATLANSNAKDGAASVPVVCGRGVAPALPDCPPEPTNRSACVKPAPNSGAYVEVRTQTRSSDNSTLLPPILAQGMVGNGTYDGTTVRTCARASWGAPRTSTGFAFTTSLCEWSEATSAGMVFAPAPPAVPDGSYERVIYVKGGPPHPCPGVVGHNTPGNFGWLDDGGNCTSTITVNSTVGGDPGASGHNCDDALDSAIAPPHPVAYMPVYDTFTGQGQHTRYHMVGVAPFVITGYSLSGSDEESWLTGREDCDGDGNNSDKCIFGYFTKMLLPNGGQVDSGAPYLGVSTVALTG